VAVPEKASSGILQANWSRPGPQGFRGLHDIQLRFKPGQRIALIGESGGGKSTLMSLMRGLYFPNPGVQVNVNGNQVREWESITNVATLIPQEPEIFENTIAYNITLGLPFREEEIMEACNVACFTGVVNQLPRGLQSSIQEKGVNLSGGQKQRLALARGVLACRNSNIVLMDEPTSSIDPKTEAEIYKNLFQLLTDKVVIASLHQLHLLYLFDYVYVLHEGRVVEEGHYKDLSMATVADNSRTTTEG
jgi:ABC-type bacteriocin/lantibiotic exporter with double-glycine peptidase domain